MRQIFVCGFAFLIANALQASCFQGLDQGAVAGTVPIIVQGEIVKVDVAKGETQERNRRRYLDLAHIKIDKVYKTSLSDVKVEVKGEVTAWMHSVNQSIPGSDVDGKKLHLSVSTDLAYTAGTKAIWFVFLAKDGKFYINRHPQQKRPVEKEAELERAGILTPERGRKVTSGEWMTQVSELGGMRKVTQDIKNALPH